MLLVPVALLAQEIVWTGGGDGTSWNDPGNWNENRVPGQDDDVIVNLNGTNPLKGMAVSALTVWLPALSQDFNIQRALY